MKLNVDISCSNLINLLLSRTFSTLITKIQARTMYNKLFNIDPIAKQMLAYTAMKIAQNNSIKIVFEKDAISALLQSLIRAFILYDFLE